MRDKSQCEPAYVPEPKWIQWWRANPVGKPFPHVETKGSRKRSRRARAGK